jgi:hypothetical protein
MAPSVVPTVADETECPLALTVIVAGSPAIDAAEYTLTRVLRWLPHQHSERMDK